MGPIIIHYFQVSNSKQELFPSLSCTGLPKQVFLSLMLKCWKSQFFVVVAPCAKRFSKKKKKKCSIFDSKPLGFHVRSALLVISIPTLPRRSPSCPPTSSSAARCLCSRPPPWGIRPPISSLRRTRQHVLPPLLAPLQLNSLRPPPPWWPRRRRPRSAALIGFQVRAHLDGSTQQGGRWASVGRRRAVAGMEGDLKVRQTPARARRASEV